MSFKKFIKEDLRLANWGNIDNKVPQYDILTSKIYKEVKDLKDVTETDAKSILERIRKKYNLESGIYYDWDVYGDSYVRYIKIDDKTKKIPSYKWDYLIYDSKYKEFYLNSLDDYKYEDEDRWIEPENDEDWNEDEE